MDFPHELYRQGLKILQLQLKEDFYIIVELEGLVV